MTRAPKYTNQMYGTTEELNERLEQVDSKEITGRNNNVMYAPPGNNQNFEEERVTEKIIEEPDKGKGKGDMLEVSVDRATERPVEDIMQGAVTQLPANMALRMNKFPFARPGVENKNTDLAAAWVKSGFNDDILNILIRMT